MLHDLADHEKVSAKDGTALERIGEEICEQLDYKPAQVRVLRHVRPVRLPVLSRGGEDCADAAGALPKSLATPALFAHIVTAEFVDGLPLIARRASSHGSG